MQRLELLDVLDRFHEEMESVVRDSAGADVQVLELDLLAALVELAQHEQSLVFDHVPADVERFEAGPRQHIDYDSLHQSYSSRQSG